MASKASSATSEPVDTTGLISFDAAKLDKLKADKPWMRDPKHFKKVVINAAAAMKMATHAAAGVDKGLRSQNAMPVEVMGLMHGHISTEDPTALVVTDVFALPVEGTETTVMAENEKVQNYMIALSEALEKTRTENFMGWYHSHPFDVGAHSNAFLSATDVSTQLLWQMSEDQAGNPWLALVVDPLRGLAKGKPEIGAFRCYPTNYTPPKGMAPDGVAWEDDKAMKARWGESCVSYYQLEVTYAVPKLTSCLLGVLARDFMWTRVLSSTPSLEKEARDRLPERLRGISLQVDQAASDVNAAALAVKQAAFERASGPDHHHRGGAAGLGMGMLGMGMMREPGRRHRPDMGTGSGSDTDDGEGASGLHSHRHGHGHGGGAAVGVGVGGMMMYDDDGGVGSSSSPASGSSSSSAAVANVALGSAGAAALSSLRAASSGAADVACEVCKGRNAAALKDLVFNLNHNRKAFLAAHRAKKGAIQQSNAGGSSGSSHAGEGQEASSSSSASSSSAAESKMAMATDE